MGTPAIDRASRPGDGGVSDSPVWAELSRIREELLWSRTDRMLTVGGLIRMAAVVTWMALALATGAQAWWGVLLLVGGGLSLLHARRGTVLRIADSAGPFGPFIRHVMPYPRVPHICPVGLLEGAGAVIANVGTGWIGGAFETPVAARGAVSAALLTMFVYDAVIVVNLTGHASWRFEPIAPFYRRVRPYMAGCCALIALGLLWPGPGVGYAYRAAVTVAVVGTGCVLIAGWCAQMLVTSIDRLVSQHVLGARRATQAVDGRYVHQLKNLARILYRQADEIPRGDLRERVRRLCVAISSTEQMLKSGRGTPARCVEDVVNGLLGLDERFAALRNVDADLDLRDLTPGDAELVAIAVGDLCSNAVNAGASRFRVGLRAEPADRGSWLVLEAECVCGRTIPEVPEDSSLMRLATLLHYNRGTFVIRDDGGSHRFLLRWPTSSRPTADRLGGRGVTADGSREAEE